MNEDIDEVIATAAEEKDDDEDLSPLYVLVNSGFGYPSYPCRINSDSTMMVPGGLVQELKLKSTDELAWTFDESEGVLYVRVIHKDWEAPFWLKD